MWRSICVLFRLKCRTLRKKTIRNDVNQSFRRGLEKYNVKNSLDVLIIIKINQKLVERGKSRFIFRIKK